MTRWSKFFGTFHIFFQAIFIILLAIGVNFGVSLISVRWDLTDQKTFTLAPSTINTLERLEDPLTLKVYLTQKLPQNMLITRQAIEDLVHELQSAGGDKIVSEIIDPATDPTILEEVNNYNIPSIEFSFIQNESLAINKGYVGMALIYRDKTAVIPIALNTSMLEYDITSSVLRMIDETQWTVGFLSSHAVEPTAAAQQFLSKQYHVRSINFAELNSDIDVLIVAGPKEPFAENELYLMDQYLMHGGKLVFLLDGTVIDAEKLTTQQNPNNLNNFLSSFGVTVNNDVIGDFRSHETAEFHTGDIPVVKEYPYWVRIITEGLNRDHPITATLHGPMLPWPSSLTLADKPDINITPLLNTTSEASAFPYGGSVRADDVYAPANLQEYTIGVHLSGRFTSAFAENQDAQKNEAHEERFGPFLAATDGGELIIMSNGRFMNDEVTIKQAENIFLAANIVDALLGEDRFFGMRSRAAVERPVAPLSPSQKITIKYGSMIGLGLFIILLGILCYMFRRKKDTIMFHRYGPKDS